MNLLYVDESGVEELKAGTSHFVLLGLMVPEGHWKQLDAAIEAIKVRYDLANQEIHTAWMAKRYSEQGPDAACAALSRADRRAAAEASIKARAGVMGVKGRADKIKTYRREVRSITPYLHLSHAERLACLEEMADAIGGDTQIRVFAEAIRKATFAPGMRTPYEMGFEQVITRFQTYLSIARETGIVIHDNNEKNAPRLHELSRKFHDEGTFYRKIPNIIETPMFVNSALTDMMQMADLCAYALRRFIENEETYLWDRVSSRVDRHDGVLVGLRHYTGKTRCRCSICLAHGRD